MRERIRELLAARKRRGLIVLLAIVGLVAAIGTASAVHDEAFELDGNIDDANPAGGPEVDWDNDIVGVGANGFSTAQTSLPAGFSAATAGPDFSTITRRGVEVAQSGDDTTFTTNSKDIVDISAEWRCVHANNVTDKGDLVNTYGVSYVTAAGEQILYFGAEKNDASGTNNLGVWFLQDPEVDCSDTQGGNGTAFSGNHVIGDILVVSEFTGGGSTATITAYEWRPGDPAAVNNLVQLGTSGVCGQAGTDDRLCAITNVSNQVNPPWKTWDKDTGSLDVIDTQQFYEGAINLTALGRSPCISKLLTDTRSSVSTTATLYDFALQDFNVCNAEMTTQVKTSPPPGTNVSPAVPINPGTPVHDTATVVGSDATKTPSGTVTFFLCSFATGTTDVCDDSDAAHEGTSIGTGTLSGSGTTATANSPDVNTAASPKAPGRYCFRAEWPGDDNYTSALIEFSGSTECFTVKDTSSITTAQKWLPNDTATVTTTGGTPVSGTVEFKLYTKSGTCVDDPNDSTDVRTFSDGSAPFETDNTTVYTTSTIISWSATFTPTDPNAVQGSTTTRCERSDLTINNSASAFPPGP
jgi:hypothetical protein